MRISDDAASRLVRARAGADEVSDRPETRWRRSLRSRAGSSRARTARTRRRAPRRTSRASCGRAGRRTRSRRSFPAGGRPGPPAGGARRVVRRLDERGPAPDLAGWRQGRRRGRLGARRSARARSRERSSRPASGGSSASPHVEGALPGNGLVDTPRRLLPSPSRPNRATQGPCHSTLERLRASGYDLCITSRGPLARVGGFLLSSRKRFGL